MNSCSLPKDRLPLPWNPHGLVNLWQIMNDFLCWQFVTAIEFLHEMESAGLQVKTGAAVTARFGANAVSVEELQKLQLPDELKATSISKLLYIQRQCEAIELEASLERCSLFSACLQGNPTIEEVGQQAKVLREAIQGDLKHKRFAFVPTERAKVLDRMGQEWSLVWEYIGDARADSEEAVYSYVLGRNDACIFHSMRVAERGLRILAKEFRVKVKHPIEYSDWMELINAINDKLKSERNKPRAQKRQERLEFYSKAADRCERMNHLWRREISHARRGVKYDESEASAALNYSQNSCI